MAKSADIRVLASVASPNEAARAARLGFDGIVTEGEIETPQSEKPVVRLLPRMSLDSVKPPEIIGTAQGLWPGIRAEQDGAIASLPTGAPWIETNGGFLRFIRAKIPASASVWIAMRPPEGEVISGRQYLQALADAAITGSRWVLALDSAFLRGLLSGDKRFPAEWLVIAKGLRFLEENREYALWPDRSSLTLLQDSDSGALYSGGFIDMMTARHIPTTITPTSRLVRERDPRTELLLNVQPRSLPPSQKERLAELRKRGITVLDAPADWTAGKPEADVFSFPKDEVKGLADAWREINTMLGRRNFGLRVFGAPGTLSSLKVSPDGKNRAVHLLNYSDYPIHDISLHLAGSFSSARILTPQGTRLAGVHAIEGGVEIEVDRIDDVAVVIVE